MEWKLKHNNLVETSNGDSFAVGVNWMLAQHEKSEFKKEIAISKQVSANKIECGCTVSHSKANVVQLAMADPELKGQPSLAATLFHMGFSNAIFCLKLSDSSYWVLCINSDHTIEMTSDNVMERFGVRDYIGERLSLKVDGDKPRIYNLGEEFAIDDIEIDDIMEQLDFAELFEKTKPSSNSVVRSLSGNLIKHLMFGFYGTLIALSGGAYFYLTTESEDLIALKNGEYSSPFNHSLTTVTQKFKKLKNSSARKRLTKDSFIALGREQYNSVVLTRTMTNDEAVEHIKSIDRFLRPRLKGWQLAGLTYRNQSFYVAYSRVYKAPYATNYKELDIAMEEHFASSSDYSVAPTFIEKEGEIRHYEITVPKKEQKRLLNFLAKKKKIANEREEISSEIVHLLSNLNKIQAEIGDTEGSVSYLGMWDKKDSALITNIIHRIEDSALSATPDFQKVKTKLKELSEISDVEIPEHSETLLQEGGVEDIIYPILQDINTIKWASYQYAQGFPRNVEDKVYEDERMIRQKVINLEFSRSVQHLHDLESVYKKDYVQINDIEVNYNSAPESLSLNIVMAEVNQDYINLKK